MKRMILCAAGISGFFLFFCSGIFSQEQAPAPRRGPERAIPAEMGAVRELVENYHEAVFNSEKEKIRAELRKTLSGQQDAEGEQAKSTLEKLAAQADSIALAARGSRDETLDSRIDELQAMVRKMQAENDAAREAGIEARLERLLAPRRERTRPEGR
jgi:DNA anti-recombination protein RmuC